MEHSYEFRLYPNAAQEELIRRTFGCCRFVYNHFLAQIREQYEETGKFPARLQQDKSISELRQEMPWLEEADSTALQSSVRDLDAACHSAANGEISGFPRFRRKHDRWQSYTSECVGTNIEASDDAVRLPNLGVVKCAVSEKVEGRILSATVTLNPDGEYLVTLRCADAETDRL